MNRAHKALVVLVVAVIAAAAASVRAQWETDGVPLCIAPADQSYPRVASDGAGGAFAAWQDERAGNWDLYFQRVDPAGRILWTINGVALCTAAGNQNYPEIVCDGDEGAIVAWRDERSGGYDVYAQHIDASGNALWASDGIPICTAAGNQYNPEIVSDGAGGAIMIWHDGRNLVDFDIYAQRVSGDGTVLWTAGGVGICTAAGDQMYPTIVADGEGGAIVAWDHGDLGSKDVYVQRINSAGTSLWTAGGVAICTATDDQFIGKIVSDGTGGAIVNWEDNRAGNVDIYVQRVDPLGNVLWTADGVAVCTEEGLQYPSDIAPDGSGGAFITWWEYREFDDQIYAQHIDGSGAALWTVDGLRICPTGGTQIAPAVISDGEEGAVFVWEDRRNYNYDIYAIRLDAAGNSLWTSAGAALCTETRTQFSPRIVPDGTGGAVVVWYDNRSMDWNVYAQLVDGRGYVGFLSPEINTVRDVPGDQGGKVYLSWHASHVDVLEDEQMSHYTIWRALDEEQAARAVAAGARTVESLAEPEAEDGRGPVIRIEALAGQTWFWELVGTQPAYYLEAYAMTVPTLFDSVGATARQNYFQVVAHTDDPSIFWVSVPDSGYSVDNLAPCMPAGLAGEQSFSPDGLALTWESNDEPDLGGYRIYRGLAEGFVPSEANLLGAPCDTVWFDGGWSWSDGFYYKVSAVDIHGNESDFALLRPDGVTGDDTPKAPPASYLEQNRPNPFNPSTRIVFGLDRSALARLVIYDAAGRLVRVLADGVLPAGRHEAVWDGRDDAGRQVASGVYFYRLEAGIFNQSRKMILLR